MTDPVVRFVITHWSAHEYRTLTFPAQGRRTYATREEAERALATYRPHAGRVFAHDETVQSLEVTPVECWPGHHDPKRTVFPHPCRGRMENGPGKRYARCPRCGAVDYELNKGDRCPYAGRARQHFPPGRKSRV